jgi:hypothetical protein
MSFGDDIKNFASKAERAATYVLRGTSLDIASAVIMRTPVDTGRLRANWQVQINSVPSGEITETDASGGKTQRKAKSEIDKAKVADSIFLVNNLPYAEVIENGSSDQAPAGMVEVTIAEYERIVRNMANKA